MCECVCVSRERDSCTGVCFSRTENNREAENITTPDRRLRSEVAVCEKNLTFNFFYFPLRQQSPPERNHSVCQRPSLQFACAARGANNPGKTAKHKTTRQTPRAEQRGVSPFGFFFFLFAQRNKMASARHQHSEQTTRLRSVKSFPKEYLKEKKNVIFPTATENTCDVKHDLDGVQNELKYAGDKRLFLSKFQKKFSVRLT